MAGGIGGGLIGGGAAGGNGAGGNGGANGGKYCQDINSKCNSINVIPCCFLRLCAVDHLATASRLWSSKFTYRPYMT